MTQGKDLLLKYLCMALPYGLVIETPVGRDYLYKIYIYSKPEGIAYINLEGFPTEECKPCIRLLSNMNEEEKAELFQLMGNGTDIQRIDFYLSNHFDFMGLIPKGLAIEVTKENNPYKE